MSSRPTLRLVDRLRGKYVLPINDGAGLLNGSDVFVREFPSPPIQKEAADRIEKLEAALSTVMTWIGNWDVPFADDDDWLEDKAKIEAATGMDR